MASVPVQIDLLARSATGAGAEVCDPDLPSGPWNFDAVPGQPLPAPSYGAGASRQDVAPADTPVQRQIPARYRLMPAEELATRIAAARTALGDRLTILGHYYQRDEVVQYADFVGDSFQLARESQSRTGAEFVVFCGVHFMAETADLLSTPDQAVILPNLAAGCSMADMADIDSVTACWEQLEAIYGTEPDEQGRVPIIPVTYMNSSAALKGFCGEHGGIVCTSSNAEQVLTWAFERGQRVLFFPDQHLGRNTASAMGVPLSAMPVWDPRKPLGGNDSETLDEARVVLWRGWCSVHQRFTPEQIAAARAKNPAVRVVVHPECPLEVVQAADESGSTQYIKKVVDAAQPGEAFAIGTEINMVRRLADARPDLTIECLDPVICPCSTMYRIHPAYLAWVLESLLAGEVVNQVTVPADVAAAATVALERMLAVKP